MAAQYKQCKNYKLCCLPGAEGRWKLLCPGAGTWHTHRLCYSFVNFHRTREQKPSLRKSHSTVTVVCNTQRCGHRIVALVGLERIRSLQEMAPAKGQPVLPPPAAPFAFCSQGLFCCCSASLVPVLTWNNGPCRENSALEKSGKNTQARQSITDYHSYEFGFWKENNYFKWQSSCSLHFCSSQRFYCGCYDGAVLGSLSIRELLPVCLSLQTREAVFDWLDGVTVFSVSPAAGACVHGLTCGTGEGNGIFFAHYRICQITSVLSGVKSTHVNHCHHSADMH